MLDNLNQTFKFKCISGQNKYKYAVHLCIDTFFVFITRKTMLLPQLPEAYLHIGRYSSGERTFAELAASTLHAWG